MQHADCVLKDDLTEILDSNKRCTIVHKQKNKSDERLRLRSKTRNPGNSDSDSTPLVLSFMVIID